eukprot:7533403-Karenia_brevis.AAC.1
MCPHKGGWRIIKRRGGCARGNPDIHKHTTVDHRDSQQRAKDNCKTAQGNPRATQGNPGTSTGQPAGNF